MIELIPRIEALRNEVFASFIGKWQKRYDPRVDPFLIETGTYFDPALRKDRYYSQEEIDQINGLELDEFNQRKDSIEIKSFNYFGELAYQVNALDILVASIEIGKTLKELSDFLNTELIFMLDYTVPWLFQKNDYEPVHKAMNYLQEIGTTEDFVGAYKLGGTDLAPFVTQLFWIIRCNASLPYCWFSTSKHEFVGDICKYGNFHFHLYSEDMKDRLKAFSSKNGLSEIEQCVDSFSADGVIYGRQIVVGD